MHKQRRLSNHDKIERYFEQCGREFCPNLHFLSLTHIVIDRATPKVDLPLEEEPSGSRVGIGSLPGPNTEVGVALLPEEHRYHLGTGRSHGPPPLKSSCSFTVAEVDPSLSMPSTEVTTDSYGGVGSLPGPRCEHRVAMTPQERLFPAGTFESF